MTQLQGIVRFGLSVVLFGAVVATGLGAPTSERKAGDRTLSDLRDALKTAAAQPDQESLAFRTNYPLAQLQLKKALLSQRQSYYRPASAGAQYVELGFELLARIGSGQPTLARKGTLSEGAYIAENDLTSQPYYLYLPNDYEPTRKCPLVVFLHGYVPTTSVLDPWTLGADVCEVADKNGCALLIPYGRRNTDFQGVGEVDILASTELVKSLYSIDSECISISGVSMGGMGAWNMVLRHPGLYAAATPMSGQTDMHVWWPVVLPNWPRDRAGLLPFRRHLVEWDNPIDLVRNARGQKIFVQHGERDTLIPVAQSRTIVEAAAGLGIPIKLYEFEGQSHYIYWDLPCFRNAWSWSAPHRLDRRPRRITYKTYSLEYDTAFWLRIADLVEWGQPATVDCEVSEDGASLSLTTHNVASVEVNLKDAPLTPAAAYRVLVNGRELSAAPGPGDVLPVTCAEIVRSEAPWPPRKRRGMCGPVEEAFDTRFLLVIGSAGTTAQDAESLANARRWATEWDKFAEGVPKGKLDRSVTDTDIKDNNLILFGTPQTNSVLARMAEKLPVTIEEQKYTVAGKTYEGEELGLVMCYPNPLAPDRYVVIYSGKPYGERCGVNHKHDLIPDFIVFRADEFSFDGTNEHEVAGYFDMNWQLSDKLTWRAARQ